MIRKKVWNLWEYKGLNLMHFCNISNKEMLKLTWNQNQYQLIKLEQQLHWDQDRMMTKVTTKILKVIKMIVIVIQANKIKDLVDKSQAHINKKIKVKKNKMIDS